MVKIYVHTKFGWNISFHCWDNTTSGMGKRTVAILEFYLLFQFWSVLSSACDFASVCQIFSQSDDRRRSHDVYRFFKMAGIESESYYRVQCYWLHSCKKVKICLPTKFRWGISIHGWDITTSGFGKRTAAILELCFLFRFWPIYSHRQVILHSLSNFVIIGLSAAKLWRHINFSRWRS